MEDKVNWYTDEVATFGDRLATAREAAGLSQSQLSRRLGVKLATLRGWENDISEPRANRLQMLSGMLNISLGWLLTGNDAEGGAPETLPQSGAPGDAVGAALRDLRLLRAEMAQMQAQMALIEKRLRASLETRQ